MLGSNFSSFALSHWSAFVWVYLTLVFGSFANYLHVLFGINGSSTRLLSFLLMEFKPQDAEFVISSWFSISDFELLSGLSLLSLWQPDMKSHGLFEAFSSSFWSLLHWPFPVESEIAPSFLFSSQLHFVFCWL